MNKQRIYSLALLLLPAVLFFILFFILNQLYPLYADDWDYSFIYGSDTRISNISDIFISQYNHYLTWGGRSVVHSICQLLLMLDKTSLSLVNTLAYISFVFILYRISNVHNRVNPVLFILLNLLIWFLVPSIYSVLIWKTGSANYLWGALIVVSFMYPYYLHYMSATEDKESYLKMAIFFICGIIAGWTNENLFVALVFFILSCFYLYRKKKKSIPIWSIVGIIGVLIGGCIMLLAPGNFKRLEVINQLLEQENINTQSNFLLVGLKNIGDNILRLLRFLSIYILLFFLYKKYPKNNTFQVEIISGSILFLLTGFVAFFAMIASPVFPLRAFLGITIMFIISICILFANIDFRIKYLKWGFTLIFSIVFITFLFQYKRAYEVLTYTKHFWLEREHFVKKQKENNTKNIVFIDHFEAPGRFFIEDLSSDPTSWINKSYSRYHDVDSVKVIIQKKQ